MIILLVKDKFAERSTTQYHNRYLCGDVLMMLLLSFWCLGEGLEGEQRHVEHAQHIQVAQAFMSSCICSAALPIIHLLEDLDVNGEGVAGNHLIHIQTTHESNK